MALTTLSDNLNIISALDDQPNDTGGLSAAELKAKFDEAGNTIQEYINLILIPEIESAVASAAQGITQDSISGDLIADGTLTSSKLKQTAGTEAVITAVIRDLAVTTAKLANLAVTVDKLANGSVTSAKLGQGAVTTAKIEDIAVVTSKIDNLAVTSAKLGQGAVTTDKIYNGAVTIDKCDDSLLSYLSHSTLSVTLSSENSPTSWTVPATGVSSTNTVIATAAPQSYIIASNCRIRVTGQATDQLVFEAETAPTSDVTFNILILS